MGDGHEIMPFRLIRCRLSSLSYGSWLNLFSSPHPTAGLDALLDSESDFRSRLLLILQQKPDGIENHLELR
jgi:hypothetical protein